MMLKKGQWVWVDSATGVPIGATVKVTPSGQRLLEDDEGNERSLSREQEASLQVMHPTSVEGVNDMIKLGDMTEAGLLRNLQLRHKQGVIYTYIGSVLVAVNPYQDFPIYSAEQVRLYHGRKLGELPPHIFAVAESCYVNMARHLRNQCCVISGETGAGKTESTKLILQYLAAVSGEHSQQRIEQQILESNPILEAFGNAKTIHNDNSSRFGKYVEVFFTREGLIEGARVEQYLLEKSRVCHQAPEEQNYHIFYCMLAGISAKERKTLSLEDPKAYKFLTKGGVVLCESRDDAADYTHIHSALKTLTFSENLCRDIFKLLAAILHLGNVCFEATTENNLETSDVSKSEHFTVAASLLDVRTSSLATSLTHRSFQTNRERVTKPLSSEQAADCRDAFVKAIYNKLFVWIVGKINSVTYKSLTNKAKSSYRSIGLLDIFGFENFNTNSFEQLCINFANERLQQFFLGHIFKLEQEGYLKEDIVWNKVDFDDNQTVLDLMAEKPCNLLALIDEESHFPKGSDSTMLNKMNVQHSGHQTYVCSKNEHDTVFGIQHFAGVVYYDSKGFLEKNRDAVSYDLIKTVELSTNKLLHQIFEAEFSSNAVKISNRRVVMTPKRSLQAQTDKRKQVPTLSGQFRQSLDSLMKALSACQPSFIRCFKPNSGKESEVFDRQLCLLQLRHSGMMNTAHIQKLGYPIRHTFEEFLKRYWLFLRMTLSDPKTETAAACCEAICKAVIGKKDDWKIGRTKIFLKDAHDAVLERLRDEQLSRTVVVIQRFLRGHRDRKSFLKKRRAAVVLQTHWRERKQKKLLSQRQCAAAVTIQTQVRGYLVRKRLKQKREAVILLQAFTRGFLARRAVGKMRNDGFTSGLENESWDQIAVALQRGLEELIIESQVENESEESDKSERRDTPEAEETSAETSVPDVDASASSSEEDDAEFDEFSFYKFSLHHFQGDTNHKHITQRLTQPLLPHDDEGDALACLTVWWIILRFMEDIPEPNSPKTISETSSNMLLDDLSQGQEVSHVVGLDQPEKVTGDGHILIGEGPTLDRPLSSLEKVHIIIGYALSRRDIRDEIYCQICKQLVNNNNRNSRVLGWTLLSICVGIFPPTDLFIKYLESFVRRGPGGYGAYCTERLRRTVANGERKELPCWIELQAARSKKPLDVSVTLMDDRTVPLHLDSASTSAEVCQAVADKTGLKDSYGFSLYISFYDKMWSLGSCEKHVLDAVSHCEQEMKQRGKQEKDAPWSLCIRKELFTPWHDCSVDVISTDLIYRQVIRGIKSEEYVSEKEDDYVQLAVKHYYIQFGSTHSEENVQKVVQECISTTLIEHKSMAKWIQVIGSAHLQGSHAAGRQSRNSVKGELVDDARKKWPLKFSKFYEVTMTSGPPLPNYRFAAAVNWSGIFFMEGRKTLLELPYHAVKEVHEIIDVYTNTRSVSLATVRGDFVLKCEEAMEMATLIENTLEGLRQRSVYALALQDINRPDEPKFLVCRRGDLLLVEKDEGHSTEENWITAINHMTGCTGAVWKDAVQFLPILTRPTEHMLELLSPGWKKHLSVQSAPQRDETVMPVSLKDFALENFRPAGKDGRQGAVKGLRREKLWVHSREPLKRPLLKSLVHNSDLSILACSASTGILKYMGDYPIKLARSPVELTDQIFGPATQHEALQDEIYCQIMRQMTSNNNRLSMECGWELMWLCSGLFPPSRNLIKHAQSFLESRRRAPLAAACLQRVQEMCRSDRKS